MEIEIAEDDSQNGSAADNCDCPVARAFSRAIGGKPCSVGFSVCYPNDSWEKDLYYLPDNLSKQIAPFVSSLGDDKIKPGKYTLTKRS